MTLSTQLQTAMTIGSGICWTLVYLLIIKRGFQDKTYGMPLWALGANISWEFLFAFVLLKHGTTQHIIDIIWCLFDVVIAFQFIRFGRSSFQGTILEKYFLPMAVLVLIVSFVGVLTLTLQVESNLAPVVIDGRYAAFAQNLMMSVLFISMLISRNNLSGQSIYIAILKMIGTLLPSLLFFSRNPNDIFLIFCYVAIFVFDLIYVWLIYAKAKELKINAWARF